MSSSDAAQIPDVSVEDAWERLQHDAKAVLVDVRTKAEWAFVGLPDLTSAGKRPLLVEWQNFPDNRIDPAFVERLEQALAVVQVDQDTELLFLCRSGGRSLMAARAMAARGYLRCRNIAGGFEGPLGPDRHRGHLGGWKAKGLPWTQG